MALVGYSDSEGSDSEPNVAPVQTKPAARTVKPGFQKVVDPSAPRRIKVELPTAKPETKDEEERPAKKARTAGLGGFNSFLPAPKRTAEKKKPGLGAGVNLRTGAEPAFSRERVEPDFPPPSDTKDEGGVAGPAQAAVSAQNGEEKEKAGEVKMVGNAMRFKPLSVANKKQKKKPVIPPPPRTESAASVAASSTTRTAPIQEAPAAPPAKKKVSLFSVGPEDNTPAASDIASEYQPMFADSNPDPSSSEAAAATSHQQVPAQADPNSLDTIAADLNLSAAARRQLFGRNKDAASAAKIMHFDMEQEYASNEVLRQQGQAQEHRAVKAVAPGKHSLQQLVNAASTQKEALEDKWAEGKRNKAEGGSRYGW